ncbi:MAG: hypothetical protein LUD03_06665 [Firmicutes bacterium]|nr:hypothetical protein [Bacillota bacterium]
MNCKKCGGGLKEDDKICPVCGEPVENIEKYEPDAVAADKRDDGGNDNIYSMFFCFYRVFDNFYFPFREISHNVCSRAENVRGGGCGKHAYSNKRGISRAAENIPVAEKR